jgi:uncharacterized protein YndB with AHSA1/START domain
VSVAAEPILRTVVVAAPVERAWEVFVERIGEWFPLATHSISGENAETAGIDGERIYERANDGTEHTWGRIVLWEPPNRLAFTWEIDPSCGNEVEVRFVPEVGGTRVELEHRGWPAGSAETRGGYEQGWAHVLGRYEAAVSA